MTVRKKEKIILNEASKNMKYLTVICSSASTRVGERPEENMASSKARTWGSIAAFMAFAKLPTQANASWEGLPLRGAICGHAISKNIEMAITSDESAIFLKKKAITYSLTQVQSDCRQILN